MPVAGGAVSDGDEVEPASRVVLLRNCRDYSTVADHSVILIDIGKIIICQNQKDRRLPLGQLKQLFDPGVHVLFIRQDRPKGCRSRCNPGAGCCI